MVGTFDYRQVPQTPSWIGSYKRPGYHSVTSCIALLCGCIAKDGAIVLARIHGHFMFTCARYSGQARECDKVSILILSIPFRSIHLSYCFRKLDSYSVQLHDTIVLPKFEGIDSMSTYWLVIFGTNEKWKTSRETVLKVLLHEV